MASADVLVTGFGAFLQHQDNPAARVARALDGQEHERWRFHALAPLPVEYGRAAELALAAAASVGARAVVALGLAAEARALRVETRARREASSTAPDMAGVQRAGQPAISGGPSALTAGPDVGALVERLRAVGLPAERSEDAGGYVCNDLLYRLLHAAARGDGPRAVCFIHLPPRADQWPRLAQGLMQAVVAWLGPVGSLPQSC